MNLKPFFQVLREFVVVAEVFFRENQNVDLRAARCDQLLLEPSNREDATRESELARHPEILSDRFI